MPQSVWLLLGLLTVTGCTSVGLWERKQLAQPQMAYEPYPLQRSLRTHLYQSREAAGQGISIGEHGSPCGCY